MLIDFHNSRFISFNNRGQFINIGIIIDRIKLWLKKYLPAWLLLYARNKINLTIIPNDSKSIVSDLFPYRILDGWNTYFELLNVPTLISPDFINTSYEVLFVFFDENGAKKAEIIKNNVGAGRETIDIKKMALSVGIKTNGNFAVFHLRNIEFVMKEGGYLTERGYVGYNNGKIKMKSYVHGNFDSVAFREDRSIICLGGSFLKKVEYRLQHELNGPALYEMCFTNNTAKKRTLCVQYFDQENKLETTELIISSKGIKWFKKNVKKQEKGRIIVLSRLNLARPIVFRNHQEIFDVFHG